MSNQNNELGELKNLLKTQNELLLEIYKNSLKTKKYIFWGRVMSFIYLLLILAPIIFVIIYLPQFIEKTFQPYQELLQDGGFKNLNIEDLLKSYR